MTPEESEKLVEEEVAKFRYTKGNWHIKNHHIDTNIEEKGRTGGYGCDHHFVCDLNDYEYHEYDDESEELANMLLIQAAPVMHKALIHACLYCQNRHGRKEPPFCRVGCPVFYALQMVKGVPKWVVPDEWNETFEKMQEEQDK